MSQLSVQNPVIKCIVSSCVRESLPEVEASGQSRTSTLCAAEPEGRRHGRKFNLWTAINKCKQARATVRDGSRVFRQAQLLETTAKLLQLQADTEKKNIRACLYIVFFAVCSIYAATKLSLPLLTYTQKVTPR